MVTIPRPASSRGRVRRRSGAVSDTSADVPIITPASDPGVTIPNTDTIGEGLKTVGKVLEDFSDISLKNEERKDGLSRDRDDTSYREFLNTSIRDRQKAGDSSDESDDADAAKSMEEMNRILQEHPGSDRSREALEIQLKKRHVGFVDSLAVMNISAADVQQNASMNRKISGIVQDVLDDPEVILEGVDPVGVFRFHAGNLEDEIGFIGIVQTAQKNVMRRKGQSEILSTMLIPMIRNEQFARIRSFLRDDELRGVMDPGVLRDAARRMVDAERAVEEQRLEDESPLRKARAILGEGASDNAVSDLAQRILGVDPLAKLEWVNSGNTMIAFDKESGAVKHRITIESPEVLAAREKALARAKFLGKMEVIREVITGFGLEEFFQLPEGASTTKPRSTTKPTPSTSQDTGDTGETTTPTPALIGSTATSTEGDSPAAVEVKRQQSEALAEVDNPPDSDEPTSEDAKTVARLLIASRALLLFGENAAATGFLAHANNLIANSPDIQMEKWRETPIPPKMARLLGAPLGTLWGAIEGKILPSTGQEAHDRAMASPMPTEVARALGFSPGTPLSAAHGLLLKSPEEILRIKNLNTLLTTDQLSLYQKPFGTTVGDLLTGQPSSLLVPRGQSSTGQPAVTDPDPTAQPKPPNAPKLKLNPETGKFEPVPQTPAQTLIPPTPEEQTRRTARAGARGRAEEKSTEQVGFLLEADSLIANLLVEIDKDPDLVGGVGGLRSRGRSALTLLESFGFGNLVSSAKEVADKETNLSLDEIDKLFSNPVLSVLDILENSIGIILARIRNPVGRVPVEVIRFSIRDVGLKGAKGGEVVRDRLEFVQKQLIRSRLKTLKRRFPDIDISSLDKDPQGFGGIRQPSTPQSGKPPVVNLSEDQINEGRQQAEAIYPYLAKFGDVAIAPATVDNKGGFGEYHRPDDPNNPVPGSFTISIGSKSADQEGGLKNTIIADMVHAAADEDPDLQELIGIIVDSLSEDEIALARKRYQEDFKGKFTGTNFETFDNFLRTYWVEGMIQHLLIPENSEIDQIRKSNPKAGPILDQIKTLFESTPEDVETRNIEARGVGDLGPVDVEAALPEQIDSLDQPLPDFITERLGVPPGTTGREVQEIAAAELEAGDPVVTDATEDTVIDDDPDFVDFAVGIVNKLLRANKRVRDRFFKVVGVDPDDVPFILPTGEDVETEGDEVTKDDTEISNFATKAVRRLLRANKRTRDSVLKALGVDPDTVPFVLPTGEGDTEEAGGSELPLPAPTSPTRGRRSK